MARGSSYISNNSDATAGYFGNLSQCDSTYEHTCITTDILICPNEYC